MEKTAEAFRTISEVADWLELPTHVLPSFACSVQTLFVVLKTECSLRQKHPPTLLNQ